MADKLAHCSMFWLF